MNNSGMRKRIIYLTAILIMVASNSDNASAQSDSHDSGKTRDMATEDSAEEPTRKELQETFFNLPIKTFGGKQLWSDLIHLHGYRLQKNVVTNHHRLLDPKDVRLAWGGRAGCQEKLDKITLEKELKPMTGRVLIVLHGLTRTRGAMKPIGKFIQDGSDITVINVSYASTRTSIDEHAEGLASVIEHLPEVTEINFLGHSMGSIVVRYYIGKYKPEGDERFGRMVMLAPPNNGSRLAQRLQDNFLFKTFWGVSGQDLSRNWDEIEKTLATPEFEFGVIAGGQPEQSALDNPLLSGKNDLVVSVEETRLIGAHDFMQQRLLHSTMMKQKEVWQAALSFLENGYFSSAAERSPIDE